jgi:hypothetical protein
VIRFYRCQVVDRGSPRGFCPAIDLYTPEWHALDDRASRRSSLGEMLVRADVTLAQHASAILDARIAHVALRGDLSTAWRTRLLTYRTEWLRDLAE